MHTPDGAYDVAVVGAGPSGAAVAIYLARAGQRVALLDKAAFPRDKPCAECLSVAAGPLLAELGVLDEIESARPALRPGFRVYAPNGTMFQGDFAAIPGIPAALAKGMAVPRMVLDAALVRSAVRAGAALHERWRLGQLKRGGSAWTLRSATGETLHARLVIAADGVHSTVAQRLGLHVPSRRHKIGLVAHLRGIAGLSDYVEMHVANRRYVGLAPLEAGRDLCNVAMVVDEARDGRRIAGKPEAFLLAALQTFPALRDRLGPLVVERHTLAISRLSVRARRLSDAHLALVGDATGYYDPFTGEGIYRALHSAELLAKVALPALTVDDLSAARLAAYDRSHQQAFRGKRLIERIIQTAVQTPPLMNHIARILSHRQVMADTVVAVTGDFLPASAVLQPGYLLRLIV